MFERMVERLIQEAMQAGKFDGLGGKGQPVDLSSYFETPADVRVAHAALREAGFAPREVDLLREIADLKAAFASKDGLPDGDRRRLRRLELELALMLEKIGRSRESR